MSRFITSIIGRRRERRALKAPQSQFLPYRPSLLRIPVDDTDLGRRSVEAESRPPRPKDNRDHA